MPNCDRGSPCDCRECRTKYLSQICPHCEFENVVEIEGRGEMRTDRKGISYMDIIYPDGNNIDLDCFKCHCIIQNVPFYTSRSEYRCQANLEKEKTLINSKACDVCGEKIKCYQQIELFEYEKKFLCRQCLAKELERNTPNPSNTEEKYEFDAKELKWVLTKIRKKCVNCGRLRWLNSENSWKTQCSKCYNHNAVR